MKANVHLEFGDRELEDFASRTLAKLAVKVLAAIGEDVQKLPTLFRAIQDGDLAFGFKPATAPSSAGPTEGTGPAGSRYQPPPPPPADAEAAVIAEWYRTYVAHAGGAAPPAAAPPPPDPV
jgi:hypothetical protein